MQLYARWSKHISDRTKGRLKKRKNEKRVCVPHWTQLLASENM